MKENILPLITDKQITKGAKFLDDLVEFDKIVKNKALGATLEILDGKAFKWSLTGINGIVSPHIPDEYKDEFQLALNDVWDGDKDFTVAADQFFSVAEQLVVKLKEKDINPYVISGAKALIETISTFVHLTLDRVKEAQQ